MHPAYIALEEKFHCKLIGAKDPNESKTSLDGIYTFFSSTMSSLSSFIFGSESSASTKEQFDQNQKCLGLASYLAKWHIDNCQLTYEDLNKYCELKENPTNEFMEEVLRLQALQQEMSMRKTAGVIIAAFSVLFTNTFPSSTQTFDNLTRLTFTIYEKTNMRQIGPGHVILCGPIKTNESSNDTQFKFFCYDPAIGIFLFKDEKNPKELLAYILNEFYKNGLRNNDHSNDTKLVANIHTFFSIEESNMLISLLKKLDALEFLDSALEPDKQALSQIKSRTSLKEEEWKCHPESKIDTPEKIVEAYEKENISFSHADIEYIQLALQLKNVQLELKQECQQFISTFEQKYVNLFEPKAESPQLQ